MKASERLFSFWGFGCLAIVGSAFFSGFYHVLSKGLTTSEENPIPVFVYLIHIQTAIFLTGLPFATYNKSPLLRFNIKTWVLLLARAFSAFAAATIGQFSIQLITLPDFMTIQAVTPLVTTVIAWPIYRETPRFTDIPILLLCTVGVVFIVQPEFIFHQSVHYSPPNAVGIVLAFAYVATNSIMYLCLRGLRAVPAPSIVTITGASTLLPVVAIAFSVSPVWPPCSPLIRAQAVSTGFFITIAILLAALASKCVPPGFLSTTPAIEIVFHVIWQVAVTGKPMPLFSIIGTCFVIIAFVFFAFRAFLLHRLSETPKLVKHPLWILLLTS